jgi:hypothetical protein
MRVSSSKFGRELIGNSAGGGLILKKLRTASPNFAHRCMSPVKTAKGVMIKAIDVELMEIEFHSVSVAPIDLT